MPSIEVKRESTFVSGLEAFIADTVKVKSNKGCNLFYELYYLNERKPLDFVLGYILGSKFFTYVEYNETRESLDEDFRESPFDVIAEISAEFGEFAGKIAESYLDSMTKAVKVFLNS